MALSAPTNDLTEHEARLAGALAFRLMMRHRLTQHQALTAVLHVLHDAEEADTHTDLARQELDLFKSDLIRAGRAFADFRNSLVAAFARLQPALAEATASLDALRPQLAEARADRSRAGRSRPAWQSPYGPPTRRRS
ncbi:hypothetical protein [Streptomyces albidoflavus]|uniref:hypothetical protein n=1 Tax=Streptomyces albidoflavus TaxID=1886 RepID=UPI00101EC5E0|nr:hypothetical protein [Streptomyces albidoflavus]